MRIFFYLEDRERTLDSPTDKIMLSLTAFADELERVKARQRTCDAMQRKARAGHVTGGRVFGYDVDVTAADGSRAYVTLTINPAEAAIVRRIFERASLVSRSSTRARTFRYVCSNYWNRGASVCPCGRMASMPGVDGAIVDLVRSEVLKPAIVERALDRAVAIVTGGDRGDRRDALIARLAAVELELANLTDTAARGGAVPTVLAALTARDDERRRLLVELDAGTRTTPMPSGAARKAQLRALLADWRGLMAGHVSEARGVLSALLADRIRFCARSSGDVELIVPVRFDRLLVGAIPAFAELQDQMASPPGIEPGSRP